ncbi:hypothetical protein NE237_026863 [Protea cynaroides]|uniref:Uncharacterized protein n=1 Tax=Protea cynaroides TaxID=273540 RepID=A0A9Q0GLH5_9MAGN|nr:hypothetical protein NE237_026863 [Protea cynaroides]
MRSNASEINVSGLKDKTELVMHLNPISQTQESKTPSKASSGQELLQLASRKPLISFDDIVLLILEKAARQQPWQLLFVTKTQMHCCKTLGGPSGQIGAWKEN